MANLPPPAMNPPPESRLSKLLAEYGPLALLVYLSIFAVSIVSFAWAIEWGFKDSVEGLATKVGGWLPWLSDDADALGSVGTWAAAWLATKLTQPLRIVLTVAITAIIHRVRFGPGGRPKPGAEAELDEPSGR